MGYGASKLIVVVGTCLDALAVRAAVAETGKSEEFP
jgi:hypothetical protein